jgi:hypothetical protein
MPTYRVPTEELKAIVNPLDGVKWGCGPITIDDILEAVEAGIEEETRSWQEVNGTLAEEENRPYHIRRLATLFLSADTGPEPDPNRRVRLILMFDDTSLRKAWFYEGNHRVAVAYLRGDAQVDIEITTPDEDRITGVFPGAVRLVEHNAPAAPAAQADQGTAHPEQPAGDLHKPAAP